MDALVAKCLKCGEPLKEPRKLKDFCSYSCRGQHTADTLNGPDHQSGLIGSKNTRRNKALRSVKQQGVAGFSVAQVNSVTYRIDRPSRRRVAYVIDVGVHKPAWIARCKHQTTNPMPLNEAKAAAMAMARGACGDYVVANPIAHLNGLTAILLDREAA